MIKKVYCLLSIIMLLLISCADKSEKESKEKKSTNVMEDDEYIKNIIKDSSK
ncbi:hypothetical protein [Brachyspira innocens]|uniref:hypothetical protein n=1 Tax=Brachyspira innocens TaxID=13264 RepID=UPI0026EF7A95|nr:hypothetical protein [Brachyspira innocens]